MMSSFQEVCLECDMSLMKYNHIAESAYDTFKIAIAELYRDNYILHMTNEHTSNVIYESKVSEYVKKIQDLIEDIVRTISKYLSYMKDKIVAKITTPKLKVTLQDMLTYDYGVAKVEIYDTERQQKMLDEYIREMAILERKLMHIKIDSTINPLVPGNQAMMEYNHIMREIDKLDDKYGKEFLDNNIKVIKMASEDAIRFSLKDLDNVRVDYDAVEKGSSEVLQKIKTDANGCEVVVKLNALQKMGNKISTYARKVANKICTYRHKNFLTILSLSAIGVASSIGIKKYSTDANFRNSLNDKAKGSLDKLKQLQSEKQAEVDRLNALLEEQRKRR